MRVFRRPTPFALAVLAVLVIALVPGIASAAGGGDFGEAAEKGWLYLYLAAFGAGFLTSLTPCVYPMIPITLAIFGARGKDVAKKRSLALAASYVLGMSLTYAVLGVVFATIFGATGFGKQLASPAVVIPLVILFVAFAASMFGAFEMNLPSGVQARLNQIGGKGFKGAFLMGSVGGLIAAPCTGPFLGGLLAFLGMGVLFFVLAAFASALPKSGAWMDTIKSVSGVLMLLAAFYFLRPLLPWLRTFASPEYWFLITAAALVVIGIALGAFHLTFSSTPAHKARKAIGLLLVLAGLFGMWTWKLTPKQKLPWVTNEKLAFERARIEKKGVMVDFSATWCIPCEELELTFGDGDVYDAITARFVPLKVDVTTPDEVNADQERRYNRDTFPHVVFVASDGTELGRIKQLVEPDAMLEVVGQATRALRGASAQK
jgi:thioredoxin:protein disulfide reductase